MQSRADQLQPLPPPIERIAVARREWNGATVDVTEFWGRGEALSELCFEGETRLTALLGETGGAPSEPRERATLPCAVPYQPRNLHFAPAGLRLWGYCRDMRYVRDVTIVCQPAALEARLGERIDTRVWSTPRLRFADDRLWSLMKLLADAVVEPDDDPSSRLYGDALTAAVVARLAAPSTTSAPMAKSPPRAPRKLGILQLRRVIEHLESRLPEAVPLADLAPLTGLSQAHFARAFKATTGVAPYRWQLVSRVRRAQELLTDRASSIDDIAAATGFADATHFGRRFRQIVGTTPAAWRRDRLR